MQLLLPAAYASVFIYIIYKFRFFECESLSKQFIILIFLLKIAAGTLLWAIYTFYYTDRSTADIHKYFDDSSIIFESIKNKPLDYFKILFGFENDNAYFDQNYYHKMNYWSKSSSTFLYNESHTIIRFNAFTRLFSLGNYHVHTVIMCFLSLIGLLGIYKSFITQLKEKKIELIAIVFFFPSMLLWSSGVLKEGLLIFSLGIVIYCLKLILENKYNKIILLSFLTLSLYLLVLTKFYAIAAIIPSLLAWLWCGLSNNKQSGLKFALLHIIYLAYVLSLDSLNDFYNISELLALKQQEFTKLAEEQHAKSYISTFILEPNYTSIIKNIPAALFNIIFRPLPWESNSPLILLAAIENIAIIAFIILSLYTNKIKKINTSPLFYLALYFSFLMLITIGLTTPIIGALVRYRSTALPFLLIVFLFIYNKNNIPFKLKKQHNSNP